MSRHHKTGLFFLSILLMLALASLFVPVAFSYFGIVGLIWFLVVLIGSAYIGSNYHVKAYCGNRNETRKNIAITFDDGPHEMTHKVLDILKKHDAQAIFFCIGKNIEAQPEILRRTVAEGHLIGNHSYSHSPFFDFFSKPAIAAEIARTDALIEQVSGKRPLLFRPPFGVTTPNMGRALAMTGHKVIGWNVRSLDGGIKSETLIFNKIKNAVSPGGIILLHDTGVHSANVLERLLVWLREKNYNVVSIEQLLNIKAYEN